MPVARTGHPHPDAPRRGICSAFVRALACATLAATSPAVASAQASGEVPAVAIPPAVDLPYSQIVDPERTIPGSLSVGTTSDGVLRRAAQLPDEGVGFYVLPAHADRDTHWGTVELVRLIEHAAERYAALTNGRFGAGNLSVRGGGDIPWSRSHNAGRDADIALPMLDPNGIPIEAATLVPLRASGVARDRSGLQLDVSRAWTLVESLVASDEAQLQWLFLYDPLKQQILAHARAVGADPELIARAEEILHQPGDSAPHDDHLHIRVFCSRDDLLDGCVNWGPAREHADLYTDDVAARADELARGLLDPDTTVAVAALQRLDDLLGERAATPLATALPYVAPRVQLGIIALLADYDARESTGALVPLLESAPDGAVREEAARVLGHIADAASGPSLAGLIARGGRPLADGTPLRRAAALAHRNITSPGSLDGLVTGVGDPDADTCDAVERVLERVTGAVPPQALHADAAALAEWWAEWRDTNGEAGQARWYATALTSAGYSVDDWDRADPHTLVRALRDDRDAIRFIADRALVARGIGWTPSEGWTIDRRARYWQRQVGP
ncbi:MAG: penicillin-insensitive murein endopeptidase [Myxococcales bacterium]|nr:penicillin-insensitive murein endopeptidase [Myxococcales bacterium]MCB9532993.1 penicillin-insensitive murein endopeptidase [Myxococcales bacterium]